VPQAGEQDRAEQFKVENGLEQIRQSLGSLVGSPAGSATFQAAEPRQARARLVLDLESAAALPASQINPHLETRRNQDENRKVWRQENRARMPERGVDVRAHAKMKTPSPLARSRRHHVQAHDLAPALI
jgi:hypothetical protein